MIHIITGDFGSGKTTALTALIERDVLARRPAILLVPEQETVSVESSMATRLPPSAPLSFEVCNFSRLANTVFRQLGGLSYHYADRSTRALCMWRAMREVAPALRESGPLDLGRVRHMAAAMRELSSLSILPQDLISAAEGMTDAPRLSEKLQDLAIVAHTYREILRAKYDDAETDLDRLYTLLLEKEPLAGTRVYLDGFISFTEQQWRVLFALAKTCDLTVALPLPAHRKNNPAFLEIEKTYARLRAIGGRVGVKVTEEDMGAPRRAKSPILTEALASLFDGAALPQKEENEKKQTKENPALRLVASEDAMAACEWIAADILRRVQEEGAHYRDFAIIARRAEQYSGILDSIFTAAGIPLFMSKHTDVSAYAAIKLIYSAYAVCTLGWRQSDVISYCKCGLSGLAQDDIDLFELYVSRWKLSGKRLSSDEEWTMNPDGYTPTWTQRGTATLERAEAVHQALIAQLSALSASCRTQSVEKHATALFEFLSAIGLEKTLAERARVSQSKAEADELSRLFAVICASLDRLVACMGELEVSAEEFVDLLRLLFGEVSLSRIPSSLDEVTVGSADLIRIGRARHVYMIGVNDGEFPAPAVEDSIFSEGDRQLISREFKKKNIDVSVDVDVTVRAARELFCFARAFAAASDSVCLLTSEKTLGGTTQKPASLFTALASRFSLPILRQAELPAISRIWSRQLAEDRLGLFRDSTAGRALSRVLEKDEAGRALCRRMESPLSWQDCNVGDAAPLLFGKEIHLSQTLMDSYTGCPFSYFCQNVLKLDAAKENTFDYSNIGNLLHAILEALFKQLKKEGKQLTDLSEDEVFAITDRLIEEYVKSICPDTYLLTNKMQHLKDTLRRAFAPVVISLYEELLQSEFRPTLFELNLGTGEGDTPGYLSYKTEDGTPIVLHGRIDRVDTWEKDGKTYLRVVDYKSGERTFSFEDVARGMNAQLLVYLFSLWKSENARFKEKLGGGELVPAGALYVAARSKDGAYVGPTAKEKVSADAKKSVYRRGLLLDDRTVLAAMEKGIEGRFIPVKCKKDGDFDKASLSSLASYEKMGELVGTLEQAISSIGSRLQQGIACAAPQAAKGKKLPCEYCDMAPICRASQK